MYDNNWNDYGRLEHEELQKTRSRDVEKAAPTSCLYGKTISGYLYSPYFFRRWLPMQFEEKLKLLSHLDLSVLNSIGAGNEDILDVIAVVAGKLSLTYTGISMHGKDYVHDSEYGSRSDRIPALYNVAGEYIGLCRTVCDWDVLFRWYWELNAWILPHKLDKILLPAIIEIASGGLSRLEVNSICMQYERYELSDKEFADSLRIPFDERLDELELHLRDMQSRDKAHDFEAHRKKVFRNYGHRIKKACGAANEIEALMRNGSLYTFKMDDELCRVQEHEHDSFVLLNLLKNIRREVNVLARLECYEGSIFEERKQLMPLEFVNSIFQSQWESYTEANKRVWIAEPDPYSITSEQINDFCYLFTKAGLLYYSRDRFAFERPHCRSLTGLGEGTNKGVIEKNAKRIMSMDRDELNNAIMLEVEEYQKSHKSGKRGLTGVSEDTTGVSAANRLTAF